MKELAALFERDLNRLSAEIGLYEPASAMWMVKDGISNSAGNLCLHLVGNLKHFIGNTLGHIPYERQREKEFADKNIPAAQLLQMIEETKTAVTATLLQLSEDDLQSIYPLKLFTDEMTTGQFLYHLYGHLNYHLGQVNYHRRLI